MKDLFVDQLLGITVLQGIARLDFARIDEIDKGEKKMKLSGSYRIAMPLAALTAMAEQATKASTEINERTKNKGVADKPQSSKKKKTSK